MDHGPIWGKGNDAAARPVAGRAVHAWRYGPPEALAVLPAPLPRIGASDVLIRVHAAAVCRADTHLLAGRPYLIRLAYGLRRPKHPVPGQSISGKVLAVGPGVTDLHPGDAVFGEIPHGGFANHAAAPARLLAPLPAGLCHAEAAALALSGVTALQGLRDAGGLRRGEQVLIIGAAGSVGTLAVQIAVAMGGIVTAVSRGDAAPRLLALGASEVIDPARMDGALTCPRFDLILDLVATRSLRDLSRCLAPEGRYVAVAIPPGQDWFAPIPWLLRIALADRLSRHSFRQLVARPNRADLEALARLVRDHGLRPVIERRFPLDDVALACRHVAAGHSRGATFLDLSPQ